MSKKTTIRNRLANAVDDMREVNGCQVVLKDLDASEATIKNYLSYLRLPEEVLRCEMNDSGVCTIYRDANARQGMNKRDVLNKLRNMRHLQSWLIKADDLQIDIKYCSNVIAGDSQDGFREAKYMKAVFEDRILVVCVNFSDTEQKTGQPPTTTLPAASPPPKPKPESPARWLQRQICYLFLDELEKQLIFKAETTKQRSTFKKLAKTAEIDPGKYGGLDFSVTYDYGKDSLVIRRKSRRKGLWHRGDLVARAANRPEKGYAQYFDEPQLPSEMLYAIRRHRGVMDHAQDLWFHIRATDNGCRVLIQHTHRAPKTETSGTRLERDVWEAVNIMALQPEIQRFPVWWAAADVEPLLKGYGFPNLQVHDVLTPEGEQDFSIITRQPPGRAQSLLITARKGTNHNNHANNQTDLFRACNLQPYPVGHGRTACA